MEKEGLNRRRFIVFVRIHRYFWRKNIPSSGESRKGVMKETGGRGTPFGDHRWMIANECLNVRYLLIIA